MSRPDPYAWLRLTNGQQQQLPQAPQPMVAHAPAAMPAPPPMVSHPPSRSIMDPAIREAQARIDAASRPNPQPLMGFNDPNSILGQFADTGHRLLQNTPVGPIQLFGPESPDAYQTIDRQNPMANLGVQGTRPLIPGMATPSFDGGTGRFQAVPNLMSQAIAMPVPGSEVADLWAEEFPAAPRPIRSPEEEASLVRSFGRMKQYLRPGVDPADLGDRMKANIAEAFKSLPSPDEWEAAARAGIAKRGWYKNSGQTIKTVYGDHTPKFTGVLAAQSPRQSVTDNLKMAIRTFGKWIEAGQPQDEEAIMKVLEQVPGATLPSRVPNTIKALRGEALVDFTDPESGSGYKVESFRRNLLGEMDYATNDTWQAKFIGRAGNFFSNKGNYLATDARTRQVAQQMGWKTAEVQETVWSFIKTLIEQTPSSSTLREGLKGISHELIAKDPDFATLLRDPDIARELRAHGFEPPPAAEHDSAAVAAAHALAGGEEAPDPRVLERLARRLERQGIEPVGKAVKAPKAAKAAARK